VRCPSRGRRDGRAPTHRFRETRPCHRNINIKKIVQHRIHIHILHPFNRENQSIIDCGFGDANEKNPKVRSVTLWRFNYRCEHTYLFSRRLNDYASNYPDTSLFLFHITGHLWTEKVQQRLSLREAWPAGMYAEPGFLIS
jgi:hypothetical protein